MCEFALNAGRNLAFDREAKTRLNIAMNKSARSQMEHNSAQFLLCMAGIKWRVPTLQCSRDTDIHHRPSSLCQIPPSPRAIHPQSETSNSLWNVFMAVRELPAFHAGSSDLCSTSGTYWRACYALPYQVVSLNQQCHFATSGGFTSKIMKLKVQGSSLERAHSIALGGALAMS